MRALPDRPIRVLRVIARLNRGGPALHVSYLTRGLENLGYDTTLVCGRLARGEDSMGFVAASLGVEPLRIPQLHREISPLHDPQSVALLARTIRRLRPHIIHTHTAKAGAVGRAAALVSGGARPPIVVHTFHGHVLRGYFDPLQRPATTCSMLSCSGRRTKGPPASTSRRSQPGRRSSRRTSVESPTSSTTARPGCCAAGGCRGARRRARGARARP